MELMNARGVKDFPPEEKIARQKLTDSLRRVFELYGFSPLETPMIERYDVLSAKYAGGAEILKETFKFKDQGERDLCLRYDLTVPFARFVGMNPTMKMPFKRYAMGNVFRDGPIKSGRMREFWQCDVDIVGTTSMLADAQCVQIAQRVFSELGLDVNIEVNSRKMLDGIIKQAGIPEDKVTDVILEVDKLRKIGATEVKKNIQALDIDSSAIEKLMKIISIQGTNDEKIDALKTYLTESTSLEGLKEISEMLSYLDARNITFNLSLARGLSYYTGTVFEVFMKDEKIFSSTVAAGGRYDNMIGEFLGSKNKYPAVGISFGIEPIMTVLSSLKKSDMTTKTVTKAYIIPIQTTKECIKIAEELRKSGVNTDMDLSGRGISKNLDYANVLKIPFVLFVGEDELKKKKLKLKDMNSGKEEFLTIKEVCKKLK